MIAIVVVASLVTYAWISGYMGFQTSRTGTAVDIPSLTSVASEENPNVGSLVVYVQNVGQGSVEVSAVYVDNILIADDDLAYDPSKVIPEGNTVEVTIAGSFDLTQKHDIKVTTTDGTFITATGKPGSGGSDGTPAHGDATSISITPETTSVLSGDTVTFTATASDGSVNWDVSSLTAWSITAGAGGSWAANVYTSANTGDWTVTGDYSGLTDTAALHIATGTLDHVVVSPDSAEIDSGDPQTYSMMAYDTVGNSWDVSTSANWEADVAAGGSWAANVYTSDNDGTWTITGTYSGKSDTAQLTVKPASQQGTLYPEADAAYTAGSNTGGSRTDMQSSNNVYYISRCDRDWHSNWFGGGYYTYNNLEYYCTFDIDDIQITESQVTKLDITLEGHYQTATGGSITATQTLYIYNFNSHQWEQKDSTSISGTTDTSLSFSIVSNIGNYIDNTGNIRIRVNAPDLDNEYFHYNDLFAIVVSYS